MPPPQDWDRPATSPMAKTTVGCAQTRHRRGCCCVGRAGLFPASVALGSDPDTDDDRVHAPEVLGGHGRAQPQVHPVVAVQVGGDLRNGRSQTRKRGNCTSEDRHLLPALRPPPPARGRSSWPRSRRSFLSPKNYGSDCRPDGPQCAPRSHREGKGAGPRWRSPTGHQAVLPCRSCVRPWRSWLIATTSVSVVEVDAAYQPRRT